MTMHEQVRNVPTIIDEAAVQSFATSLRGPLLRPDDDGYDEARAIWNGMIDKHPALIARCTGTADVAAAVTFAREHDLPLSVRGGGHNIAGTAVCDDGLMIDLSQMNGVHVDPQARTVRAQGGALWGDVDHETQQFGLAVPSGFVSSTGIAGLTLGGGFGWLARKHGLTCDNLRSVEIVTADGQVRTASTEQNADLFWGVCGGGGNFGVVTSFEYQLQPLGPTVLAGLMVYPFEQAREVLKFFQQFTASAPEELGALAVLRNAPPAPFLPQEVHGKPIAAIFVCYAGSVEAGQRVVQPLKEFGTPIVDKIMPKPYTAQQQILDATAPHGRRYYWKSEYLPGISDEAIDTCIAHAPDETKPYSAALLFQLGGAISRIDANANAAAHRDAAYVLNIQAAWDAPEETDRYTTWAREFWEAMQPYSTGGVYVNFLSDDEGGDRVRAAYGDRYSRLVALKNQYDPTNLFRMNQNIKPAT
jgi:FAD/FMN-containing dehydrogenase